MTAQLISRNSTQKQATGCKVRYRCRDLIILDCIFISKCICWYKLSGCLHAVIPHAQCPTTMPPAVLHIASPSQSQGLLYPPAWERGSVGFATVQLVCRLSKRRLISLPRQTYRHVYTVTLIGHKPGLVHNIPHDIYSYNFGYRRREGASFGSMFLRSQNAGEIPAR